MSRIWHVADIQNLLFPQYTKAIVPVTEEQWLNLKSKIARELLVYERNKARVPWHLKVWWDEVNTQPMPLPNLYIDSTRPGGFPDSLMNAYVDQPKGEQSFIKVMEER